MVSGARSVDRRPLDCGVISRLPPIVKQRLQFRLKRGVAPVSNQIVLLLRIVDDVEQGWFSKVIAPGRLTVVSLRDDQLVLAAADPAISDVAGWMAEHGFAAGIARAIVAQAVGTAVILAFGAAWLAVLVGFDKAIAAGVVPFLVPSAVKIVLGGLLVGGIGSRFARTR